MSNNTAALETTSPLFTVLSSIDLAAFMMKTWVEIE